MNRRAGFTLIELIIVIVVVAIAVAAIGSAFAYMSRAQTLATDLQRASQIAQECAEHIIGLRRGTSYAAVAPTGNNSTICNALPTIPGEGFTRTVNITVTAGAGASFCSAGWTCNRVEVIARKDDAVVTLNFMFINY